MNTRFAILLAQFIAFKKNNCFFPSSRCGRGGGDGDGDGDGEEGESPSLIDRVFVRLVWVKLISVDPLKEVNSSKRWDEAVLIPRHTNIYM